MTRLLPAFLALLAGLAQAQTKAIVLPSGERGYSIRCDNENINACYERAGDVCHRGYDIETANAESGYESEGGAYVGPGFISGTVLGVSKDKTRSTSEKGFIIRCKEPDRTEKEREDRIAKEQQERAERERAHQKATREGFLKFLGILAAVIIVGVAVDSYL